MPKINVFLWAVSDNETQKYNLFLDKKHKFDILQNVQKADIITVSSVHYAKFLYISFEDKIGWNWAELQIFLI